MTNYPKWGIIIIYPVWGTKKEARPPSAQEQGQKVKIMDDVTLVLKLRKIMTILTFLTVLLVAAVTIFRFSFSYINSKQNITSGYITKKEIIPAKATSFIFFHYSYTEYRIYINFEYEGIFGESLQGSKYFSVDESVYQQYHVGDLFDVSYI